MKVVCVDLDGTLLAGDLLWESFVELLKRSPLRALAAIAGLWRGKAHFKRQIALEVQIDPDALPYRPEVLEALDELRRQGASLVLATASDEAHARAVAGHLGIFASVLATDGRLNLSGRNKAAALVERFGEREFDYFGNGWADVPVWRVAADATAVAASPSLVRRVRDERPIQQLSTRQPILASLARALRPHQWVKNVLVFIPMIAAHKIAQLDVWAAGILTFGVFSLCASAVYLLNDIFDIKDDRRHPRKRTRPFAAGELSIPFGVLTSLLLISVALAIAAIAISLELVVIAAAYLIVTTAYTLILKRKPVADVFTLTGLYVFRIVAGGVATGTVLSSWFSAFALFFFLSLAFVKRYSELVTTQGELAGRGYGPDDALWMHAIGTSSGYMAVLVLALYVSAPDVAALYSRPHVLWILCPLLLFWITRLWFRAGRKVLHDDPVVEALKDPWSYVMTSAAGVAILYAAM